MRPQKGLSTIASPIVAGEQTPRSAHLRARVHPALTVCAAAAILVPAHPSLQTVFLAYGISAAVICACFATPVLYAAMSARLFPPRIVKILVIFLAYIIWLLIRSVFSPALGQSNYFSSIRSLLILTPLALLVALVASTNERVASRAIFVFGLLALAHYCFLLLVGGSFDDPGGFRSLSSDADRRNYQSTSFYFGFVALGMVLLIFHGRGLAVVLGAVGVLLTIVLMGTIGARSSPVAVAASAIWIALSMRASRTFRRVLTVVAVGLVVLGCLWVTGVLDSQAIGDQLVVIDRFLVLTEGDDSSHRIRLFQSAIEMWLHSPSNFLVGGGVGAFPQFIRESEEGWYPHNFVLESLAEGGLVAGVCLGAIGILFTRRLRSLKIREHTLERTYLFSLAIYAVIAYQFMGGLQTLWIPTFFVALSLFSTSGQTR